MQSIIVSYFNIRPPQLPLDVSCLFTHWKIFLCHKNFSPNFFFCKKYFSVQFIFGSKFLVKIIFVWRKFWSKIMFRLEILFRVQKLFSVQKNVFSSKINVWIQIMFLQFLLFSSLERGLILFRASVYNSFSNLKHWSSASLMGLWFMGLWVGLVPFGASFLALPMSPIQFTLN